MRLVEMTILSARDTEVGEAQIVLERQNDRGEWVLDKKWNVRVGEPRANRRLLIHDDERLVIGAVPSSERVYNKEGVLVQSVVEEDDEV